MLVVSVLNKTTLEIVCRRYCRKRKVGPIAIANLVESCCGPHDKFLIEVNPNVEDFNTYEPFKD